MRAASGSKFSLGSAFGRKTERKPSYSGNDFGQPDSPANTGYGGFGNPNANGNGHHGQGYSGGLGNGNTSDDPGSPGISGPGATFDGFGKKLGKTFAHQSLLPSLGNKDQRALQDVISAEKGVLNTVERFANESSKASASLQPYGLQEGPDLHDVLVQSSLLLNHLSSSLVVFNERQASLRAAYKRIREREEALADLRSRRRTIGNKAEAAERKLAKMGPENKQLPTQTELLESLRGQMRGMDTEIVNEESKIGDFKRQSIKEALSYKFAGLEELGEKLCIIGELGKLVIEEIPLDETPPGYGRAPYNGFAKTESAVDEAGRCLAQVKFNPVSFELNPSHLPRTSHTLGREHLPGQESLAAAEEYGNVPPQGSGSGGYDNRAPPPVQSDGQGGGLPPSGAESNRVGFALDDNPYGGLDGRYGSDNNAYREYGGTRSDHPNGPPGPGQAGSQVVWQGPTEEALARQNGPDNDYRRNSRERIASLVGAGQAQRGPSLGPVASITPDDHQRQGEEAGHDYEYAQQAEMDRQNREERAAWREQATLPERVEQHGQDSQSRAQAPMGTGGPGHQRELAIGEVMHNPYDSTQADSQHRTAPLNIRPRGSSPAVDPNANSDMTGRAGEYNYGSEGHDHGNSQEPQPSPLIDPGMIAAINALAPPPSFAQMGQGQPQRGISPSIGDSGTEGFRTPAESPAMMQTESIPPAPAPAPPAPPAPAASGQDGTQGSAGLPIIALAPQFEGECGDDTSASDPNVGTDNNSTNDNNGDMMGQAAISRGTSPLPPVPGIQDPSSFTPHARGPSPRPLPDPTSKIGASSGASNIAAPASPSSPYSPSALGTGGKISAGAFRKPQPRRSDTDGEGSRRLPVPPGPPGVPGGQGWADEKKMLGEQMRLSTGSNGNPAAGGQFADAPADAQGQVPMGAPPGYTRENRDSRGEHSLR